jgi:CheY-like chemotaxis protein
MLSELGYRVLKANDANSALAIIDSGMPIDLLFTDVVMPGPLRSPELARKARERVPGIAVLFTSGYTENAIVHGGRLDAGVELLSKPYTREALARKLRHVLSNQRQREVSSSVQAAGSARALSATSAGGASSPPTRVRHILFVEDDDLVRSITGELFEALGHVVHQAGDGASALALLQREHIDVLITDVGLPGMSGEELALRVRALRSELDVVFATGDHNHASAVPGAMFLTKPYDTVSIEAILQRLENA